MQPAIFPPRIALACSGALALSLPVAATTLTSFAYPVLPTHCVYYDPTQSGTGLTVDVATVGGQRLEAASTQVPTLTSRCGAALQNLTEADQDAMFR